MTERLRSQMQMSEMRTFAKNLRSTVFDKLRNTVIRKSINIASLLFQMEQSRLRCFGCVSRLSQKQLLKQSLHTEMNGKRTDRGPLIG